ncbi:homocitrate synthase [Clostridium sp. 'White wine YQ']|uniref:homocitrate synthase n=1 Tax=Clostridium sp. 'White wine YQ' TaxID=3027474 RepID=UPI0023666A9B|nr:homocitrate synthase [Clostridium sp. 'White wine YQ']MDD7795624.1 homocitrate synthase [Clostridium sp. 'White wine YQ']
MDEVLIVDTTLRDGEQKAGIAFSPEDKVNIAKILDNNKIYQIEAGIPAMGNIEKKSICKILEDRKFSKISVWNRLNRKDLVHSVECNPDIIHISVPVSEIQIKSKLKKDNIWVENRVKECVTFVKEKGYEVTIGFEDASRADIAFMCHLMKILKSMEVNRVRLADTVGILTPSKTALIINKISKNTEMDLEMHAHNDFGMAVANSIEASKNGVKYIDCTVDGIGERAGNCSLQKFLKVIKEFNPLNEVSLDIIEEEIMFKKLGIYKN